LSEAPPTFRQRVMGFDTHSGAGDEVAPPVIAGMAQWVYVLEGSICVGGQQALESDARLAPFVGSTEAGSAQTH
jgi:hypothetical protein